MSKSYTEVIPSLSVQEKNVEIQPSTSYSIEKKPANLGVFPLDSPVTVCAHITTWVLFFGYLTWRVKLALAVSIPNNSAWAFLWLNILMEVMNIVPDFLSRIELFLYIGWGRRPVHGPSFYLHGELAPTIDICITCCGESLDVIMDTVAGAASQDYPRDRFRVFLLDDARDPEVQQAVRDFNNDQQHGFGRVIYLAREKPPGVPHYYKAGNLRFGLEESARLDGGSEFVAALDADMIPVKDWLRRVVPHLLLDQTAAMAMPPQRFYNAPKGDILGQDTNVFARLSEPINDSLGGTCCTGSGYVMRRSALDSTGGWPLQNAGEDILCSWMLTDSGWSIKFVRDEVQFGLVPDSLAAWFKQRARWTDGNILSYRRLHWFLFNRDSQGKRTRLQCILGLCHVLKTYMAIPNIIMIVLLPLISFPVEVQDEIMYTSIGQCYLVFLTATLLHKFCFIQLHKGISVKAAKDQQANRFWNTPLNAARIIRSWIPGNIVSFEITGAVKSPINERSAHGRKPFWTRVCSPMILMYAGWIIYSMVPVLWRLAFYATQQDGLTSRSLVPPSPAAVVFLFSAVVKLSVPVRYMAWPPTVPERRELLEKNVDGVFRAPEGSKVHRPADSLLSWKDVVEVLIILWGVCS
ncbi:nucleotide-diphospho-sugar transferase [Aspergillus unguis]